MNDLEKFKHMLAQAERFTAFTGAGISTLSGIPDFRGNGGIYTQKHHGVDTQRLYDIAYFTAHSEIYYEHARPIFYNLAHVEPNIVHTTLARWQKKGLLKHLYTQNIDNLHQRAGSENVGEFHGTMEHHYCMQCRKMYAYADVVERLNKSYSLRCDVCGGLIRPAIVFFGEGLDEMLMDQAERDFRRCDLLLALGSSLTVYPCAAFPKLACMNGARLVIVNKDPTPLDDLACLRFDDLRTFFEAMED